MQKRVTNQQQDFVPRPVRKADCDRAKSKLSLSPCEACGGAICVPGADLATSVAKRCDLFERAKRASRTDPPPASACSPSSSPSPLSLIPRGEGEDDEAAAGGLFLCNSCISDDAIFLFCVRIIFICFVLLRIQASAWNPDTILPQAAVNQKPKIGENSGISRCLQCLHLLFTLAVNTVYSTVYSIKKFNDYKVMTVFTARKINFALNFLLKFGKKPAANSRV